MPYQIGTDEAGYGPNLGPLVICGTRWLVPNASMELYEKLSASVCDRTGLRDRDRICICDSKALHNSSGSIEPLERSVLSILWGAFGVLPRKLSQLEKLLNCSLLFSPAGIFEEVKSQVRLPLATNLRQIETLGAAFRDDCQQHSIALDEIRCRSIFPDRFNELIAHLGNKAELLSSQSIGVAGDLLGCCAGDTKLVCDKHGGRSNYRCHIHHYLTDVFVTVEAEGQRLSRYRWCDGGTQIELNFQAGGESFLPTALSSLIAKYLRELCMQVWNTFWSNHIPGIQPTKGYPVDARRFRREIARIQRALKIEDHLVWRIR